MVATNQVKVNLDGGKEGWSAVVSEKGIAICDDQQRSNVPGGTVIALQDAIAIAKAVLMLTQPQSLSEDALDEIEEIQARAEEEEKRNRLDELEWEAQQEGIAVGWGASGDGLTLDERIASLEQRLNRIYMRDMNNEFAANCLSASW
jgi:hypothetical protein